MKLKKYSSSSFNRTAKKQKNYKNIVCINCGEVGHIYKNCPEPIRSYGMICCKLNKINLNYIIYINEILNQPHYIYNKKEELKDLKLLLNDYTEEVIKKELRLLLINRRNSIAIIEFIRGKYTIKDYKYLLNLFYQMTNKEKQDLLNHTFDYNWKKIWLLNDISEETHKKEYTRSKKNYKLLKDGIVSYNIFVSLEKLVKLSCNKFEETEWGFPKGRRNLEELDIDCAKREFNEETNIIESEYNLLNIKKLEELYMGTNKIKYKLIYFISQYNSNKDIIINESNRQQKKEVSKLCWYNYKELIEKIRDYNIDKINIVNTFYYNIINLILGVKEKINNII